MMISGGTMEQELLSAEGIKNAAEGFSDYNFPEENWKETDPDAIFLNGNIHLIDLETSDLYKKKSAVKGDKVYNVDIDVLAIGSMRSFEILKDVLATVYEDYTNGTPYEPAYPSLYKQ
jgi:ABC-type Fe3+-hydroxamate transport system substrate-binding protein